MKIKIQELSDKEVGTINLEFVYKTNKISKLMEIIWLNKWRIIEFDILPTDEYDCFITVIQKDKL